MPDPQILKPDNCTELLEQFFTWAKKEMCNKKLIMFCYYTKNISWKYKNVLLWIFHQCIDYGYKYVHMQSKSTYIIFSTL